MNFKLSRFNLFFYSILCISFPYIVAICLITPFPIIFYLIFLVQICSIFLGMYSTSLLKNFKNILPRFKFSEKSIVFLIITIYLLELIYSKNIPLLSPFFGPKVEWNEYGIPFIHTFFNSLCLFYVVRYVSVPMLIKNQNINNTKGFNFSILILLLNISTFQRLNFCLIISGIFFPYICIAINSLIKLISSYKINFKDIRIYLSIFIFILLLTLVLSQLGNFRNDLTERYQLLYLGEFEYTNIALLIPTPLRVLLSYFTSPLLNSYFNKDYLSSINSPDIYLTLIFPYFVKYINYSVNLELEIINRIFNSFNSTSNIFYLKIGPIIIAIMYYFYGQFVSYQINNFKVSKYPYIPLSNIIIGFAALSIWFFVEWWNYPSIVLALILSFLLI